MYTPYYISIVLFTFALVPWRLLYTTFFILCIHALGYNDSSCASPSSDFQAASTGEKPMCVCQAAPAQPRQCRRSKRHPHCSDRPSHPITHVTHRAPDAAVTSHLHVSLSTDITPEDSGVNPTLWDNNLKQEATNVFVTRNKRQRTAGCAISQATVSHW